MKKINFILIVCIFLVIPLVQAAVTIDIDMKESFGLGEKVIFDYTLVSDIDVESSLNLYVDCPSAPVPPILTEIITLTKNIPYKNSYEIFKVDESIEPQTCKAIIVIPEPIEKYEEKEFIIITNPSFEFKLFICKDSACAEKSKVFVAGETAYLDYESDVSEPAVSAKLIYPDKTETQLTLPTSVKAEQIGTYDLEITASKDGYKTLTMKDQLGVIREEAKIKDIRVCNGDGVCSGEENTQNCPQDCPLLSQEVGINYLALIIIITIALAVITFGYVEFKRLRKSHGMEEILELKTYIIDCINRGYALNQIKQGLLKDGWDKNLIEKAFKTVPARKATPTELIEMQSYIQLNLRKGFNKKQICNNLLKDGWHNNDIDEAFKNLNM